MPRRVCYVVFCCCFFLTRTGYCAGPGRLVVPRLALSWEWLTFRIAAAESVSPPAPGSSGLQRAPAVSSGLHPGKGRDASRLEQHTSGRLGPPCNARGRVVQLTSAPPPPPPAPLARPGQARPAPAPDLPGWPAGCWLYASMSSITTSTIFIFGTIMVPILFSDGKPERLTFPAFKVEPG